MSPKMSPYVSHFVSHVSHIPNVPQNVTNFVPMSPAHVTRVSPFSICSIFYLRDSISTIYVRFLCSSLLCLDVNAERLRGIDIQEDKHDWIVNKLIIRDSVPWNIPERDFLPPVPDCHVCIVRVSQACIIGYQGTWNECDGPFSCVKEQCEVRSLLSDVRWLDNQSDRRHLRQMLTLTTVNTASSRMSQSVKSSGGATCDIKKFRVETMIIFSLTARYR
jgi:hypothetical protein